MLSCHPSPKPYVTTRRGSSDTALPLSARCLWTSSISSSELVDIERQAQNEAFYDLTYRLLLSRANHFRREEENSFILVLACH